MIDKLTIKELMTLFTAVELAVAIFLVMLLIVQIYFLIRVWLRQRTILDDNAILGKYIESLEEKIKTQES